MPPDCCDKWNADLQKPLANGLRVIAALLWVAVVAGLFVEPSVVIYTAILYAAMIAYLALYGPATTTSSPRRGRRSAA